MKYCDLFTLCLLITLFSVISVAMKAPTSAYSELYSTAQQNSFITKKLTFMTATLMVQGTTSNAGKSVLVAGLARLFHNAGLSVAPFKPQNMALNSAVTINGGEIGRSQAVQALACGIEPHTDMNPILLKPTNDKGAQVIIHGHSIGDMSAVEYHAFKKTAINYALESYERLAAKHDVIVIEGAGSPAEINLRQHDVANMGFATRINCPVLLVADIDRGGVFAHLTGTLECLTENERALIKGFVINRFRGDKSLLNSGVDWLTQKTRKETLGVLPFLHGLHIETEDSVDLDNTADDSNKSVTLSVVVPRIPRISNHTDIDVLKLNPTVSVRFVEEGEDIPPCDLVILPGSKNTIGDMNWLVKNNWPEYIKRHLRYGGKLIGICGGYQMIGEKIHDPNGLEGPPGSCSGLGLMQFETRLEPNKQLTNISGYLHNSQTPVRGYEIHMGTTYGSALSRPAINLEDGREDGVVSCDNQIFCTYLHGVFDNSEACVALLKWAGHTDSKKFDYDKFRDHEINRVATMMKENLNLKSLSEILNLPLLNNL